MPGFVTHYLFGISAYKLLSSEELKKTLKTHPQTFILGLQGPDLFYYYIPTAAGLRPNMGNIMHKQKTGAFFEQLMEAGAKLTDKSEQETALSYIEGYMGHYLLDTVIHPYVYSQVGTSTSQKTLGTHFALESDIDNHVLQHFKQLPAADFSHASAIHLSKAEKKTIANLLSAAIARTYGINISAKLVKAAMASLELESNLLTDSKLKKQKLISCIENVIPGYPVLSPLLINNHKHRKDPCNEKHSSWSNPWDSGHEESSSVFELMDKNSSIYAENMMIMAQALNPANKNRLSDEAKLLARLGNNSYNSGLDCRIELVRDN